MAIIFDDCGYAVPEFLAVRRCAKCGVTFREDESDWLSLCQECGEDEEEDTE